MTRLLHAALCLTEQLEPNGTLCLRDRRDGPRQIAVPFFHRGSTILLEESPSASRPIAALGPSRWLFAIEADDRGDCCSASMNWNPNCARRIRSTFSHTSGSRRIRWRRRNRKRSCWSRAVGTSWSALWRSADGVAVGTPGYSSDELRFLCPDAARNRRQARVRLPRFRQCVSRHGTRVVIHIPRRSRTSIRRK